MALRCVEVRENKDLGRLKPRDVRIGERVHPHSKGFLNAERHVPGKVSLAVEKAGQRGPGNLKRGSSGRYREYASPKFCPPVISTAYDVAIHTRCAIPPSHDRCHRTPGRRISWALPYSSQDPS